MGRARGELRGGETKEAQDEKMRSHGETREGRGVARGGARGGMMSGVERSGIGGTLRGSGMTEVTRVIIVEVPLVSIGAASASWRRQERGDLTARKGRVADGKGGHIGRKMTSGQKGRGTASEMETFRDGIDPDHEA